MKSQRHPHNRRRGKYAQAPRMRTRAAVATSDSRPPSSPTSPSDAQQLLTCCSAAALATTSALPRQPPRRYRDTTDAALARPSRPFRRGPRRTPQPATQRPTVRAGLGRRQAARMPAAPTQALAPHRQARQRPERSGTRIPCNLAKTWASERARRSKCATHKQSTPPQGSCACERSNCDAWA